MTFQPLSGPGWRVNKPGRTVEQIRAEIAARLASTTAAKVPVPPIIPADRGRYSANWKVEDLSSLPAAAQAVVADLMREVEVEDTG